MSLGRAMRHTRLGRMAAIATFAALTAAASCAAFAQDRLSARIAVEGAFPPFNYLDANNTLQGFDVDIAKALCLKGNLECTFVIQKWDDMIPNLLDKHYDAIVSSMSMSAERREKVAFTNKYYDSPSIFIVNKSSTIRDTTPDALRGVKLGVGLKTVQAAFAEKFYKSTATISIFPTSPDLYNGLANGSVDVIMEDKLAVYDWLTNTKAGQCCEFRGPDIRDVTFFGEGSGIALRPSDTALRDRFNAAIDAIQADGTYDTINAKYFPFSIQ